MQIFTFKTTGYRKSNGKMLHNPLRNVCSWHPNAKHLPPSAKLSPTLHYCARVLKEQVINAGSNFVSIGGRVSLKHGDCRQHVRLVSLLCKRFCVQRGRNILWVTHSSSRSCLSPSLLCLRSLSVRLLWRRRVWAKVQGALIGLIVPTSREPHHYTMPIPQRFWLVNPSSVWVSHWSLMLFHSYIFHRIVHFP